jgi:hypothetical protein
MADVSKHYRGHLRECSRGKVNPSMLFQEVTIEEYLAIQYPAELLSSYPDQAGRDRNKERAQILSALVPGDTLWLWTHTEGDYETGGLAVKYKDSVIQAWEVWSGWRED